jgi:hypothetical protein
MASRTVGHRRSPSTAVRVNRDAFGDVLALEKADAQRADDGALGFGPISGSEVGTTTVDRRRSKWHHLGRIEARGADRLSDQDVDQPPGRSGASTAAMTSNSLDRMLANT